MKVILVAVSSLDGKITRGGDPNIYSWTSKEDTKLFFSSIKKHNLIVMGSKTYEAARGIIKLQKNKLRIVLTRNPKKYAAFTMPQSLEFSSETPQELIYRLETKGYKKMLLVGGSEISTLFFKFSLVDEMHLTIEPYIFGIGKTIVNEELYASLKLISFKKLNKQGTLRLKYKVQRQRRLFKI